MRRRPLQRQYLLMPFFLVLGVPLTASCQEAPAPAVQSAAAYEATCRSFPACCRDHVYIFLVNGLDPINFGRLLGLRDYVRKLGFRQTYYGQMFHAAYFKKEIRRIHQEDAEAHFVFIGFSAGMNVAHSMAAAVNPEIEPRRGDAELVEKDFRHLGIEMLSGVQYDLFDIVTRANRPRDRRSLDELRPGAKHAQNAVAAHSAAARNSGRKRACCNMQRPIVSR